MFEVVCRNLFEDSLHLGDMAQEFDDESRAFDQFLIVVCSKTNPCFSGVHVCIKSTSISKIIPYTPHSFNFNRLIQGNHETWNVLKAHPGYPVPFHPGMRC